VATAENTSTGSGSPTRRRGDCGRLPGRQRAHHHRRVQRRSSRPAWQRRVRPQVVTRVASRSGEAWSGPASSRRLVLPVGVSAWGVRGSRGPAASGHYVDPKQGPVRLPMSRQAGQGFGRSAEFDPNGCAAGAGGAGADPQTAAPRPGRSPLPEQPEPDVALERHDGLGMELHAGQCRWRCSTAITIPSSPPAVTSSTAAASRGARRGSG